MNYQLALSFIPTMLLISITPGMCMTLAMTLGMSIGLRKSMWMMAGEILGVSIVAAAAAIGVATLMLQYPGLFNILKYLGGAYLIWLGVQLWRSKGKLSLSSENATLTASIRKRDLAIQGFVTAVVNPKGWAFMVSLLPQFIDTEYALIGQLSVLLIIIGLSELLCMILYAIGGKSLRHFLEKSGNVKRINRLSGTLMIGVGLWLALG